MSNKDMTAWYQQVSLRRGNTWQTAWVPEKHAKVGAYLKLVDEDGWKGVESRDRLLVQANVLGNPGQPQLQGVPFAAMKPERGGLCRVTSIKISGRNAHDWTAQDRCRWCGGERCGAPLTRSPNLRCSLAAPCPYHPPQRTR